MTNLEKAAYEARIKELREALDRLGHHEICHESCEVCKLLTTPDDSSALDARLAAERERCMEVCRKIDRHTNECPEAISYCIDGIGDLK